VILFPDAKQYGKPSAIVPYAWGVAALRVLALLERPA
jgi:hypothetical protein